MQVISGFIKRVIESFIQTIPSNGRFIKKETDVCAWTCLGLDKGGLDYSPTPALQTLSLMQARHTISPPCFNQRLSTCQQ